MWGLLGIVGGLVVVALLILALVATMFRKAGPNQALIVYGFGGTRVVVGGGKVVWPMIQSARELSLELMSFDVAPQQDLYTNQGVAVNVEAVAQIKVKSDEVSIKTASEQFLTKNQMERDALIRLVMEGHLRGIVGQLTVESIVKEPEMVADRMRANVAEDMAKMGLEVISFTIREVRDNNEYIVNMGRPDVVSIRRAADIATAEADRDTKIKRAQALREASIAEAVADQEKVIAETASQTRQAEAVRDLEVKRAEYAATVKSQQAQADLAYEIQSNIERQRVVAEEVRVEQVRKQQEVAVQEAEILRREKELIATVLKAAEVERQRIETLAEADRQKQVSEATGRAEATRLQGQAEAEALLARGNAEAEALRSQADAYQEFNQAAVLDRLLTVMPELAQALAAPLGRVDKITVVSTGDGNTAGSGINRLTNDVATMVAQTPAMLEALTGISIGDLLRSVPQIRQVENGATNGHEPPRNAGGKPDSEPTV
ncbi:MAG: flotillin family protein [Thermomicrobiales bacterium]|nr:flotillin family protein [Thermomicrobiales bacterium]